MVTRYDAQHDVQELLNRNEPKKETKKTKVSKKREKNK
jgi:hypothetical protein